MKTNDLLFTVCAILLCIFLSLPAGAQTEKKSTDEQSTADPELQPTATITLGGRATPDAAQDWRKRRLRGLARLLEPRGVIISDEDIDILLGPLPPDFDFEFDFDPDIRTRIAKIRNGIPTMSLLSVGMLIGGKSEGMAYSRCTVTLTRSDTVVTARHCLAEPHGHKFWVYFPYGGIREIADDGVSFFCSDGATGCSIKVDDLAIVKLKEPYKIIPPSVAGTAATAVNGQHVTIVGYGLNNGDLSDYAIKREGTVALADCISFSTDGLSLCFEYVETMAGSQAISGGQHVNCNNDSGGPMLSPAIVSDKMIGVASQLAGSCDGTGEGRYVNATNTRYQTWLSAAYCDPACLHNPNLVLSELAKVPEGYLTAADSARVHTLNIPIGAKSFVVTLNHSRGRFPNTNDLDMTLPPELNPVCEKFLEVEVCTVDSPPAGVYNATVTRFHGDVEYQLSAVALAQVAESSQLDNTAAN